MQAELANSASLDASIASICARDWREVRAAITPPFVGKRDVRPASRPRTTITRAMSTAKRGPPQAPHGAGRGRGDKRARPDSGAPAQRPRSSGPIGPRHGRPQESSVNPAYAPANFPAIEWREGQGRPYTVSIALPGSIVSNAQSPELRTYLVGQIARAAAVFNIDEASAASPLPRAATHAFAPGRAVRRSSSSRKRVNGRAWRASSRAHGATRARIRTPSWRGCCSTWRRRSECAGRQRSPTTPRPCALGILSAAQLLARVSWRRAAQSPLAIVRSRVLGCVLTGLPLYAPAGICARRSSQCTRTCSTPACSTRSTPHTTCALHTTRSTERGSAGRGRRVPLRPR
jgi:hypothetical protein